jgi:hypothetical protein
MADTQEMRNWYRNLVGTNIFSESKFSVFLKSSILMKCGMN